MTDLKSAEDIEALVAELHACGRAAESIPAGGRSATSLFRRAADCIEDLRTEIDATLKRAKASEAEARNLRNAGVTLFDQLAAANARVDAAERETEQCHNKATCMCGSYVSDHSIGSGHSPVSMYDYALDREREACKAAEAKLAAAVQALEEIAGYSILPFPTENGVSLNVTAAKLVYDAWAQSVQIARRALPPAAGGAE